MLLRLGFALLLGAALAGCSDDGLPGQSTSADQTSTASGTSSAQTGTGDTANATTSTDTGTGDSTGDTTGGSSSGTTEESSSGSSTTGTDSTTDGTGSEGSTTEGGDQSCANGCVVEFMCGNEWPTEQACVDWCEANLIEADKFSPFCRDAWAGVSACVGTLTCEEFAEWAEPAAFPYPCSDADAILNVECKGQGG